MKNKFVYTLIVFCLGFGSPAWSAEETADSTLLGTLFNATMFQPNSSDSLTYARHKKTFFHRVGDVFTKLFREFNTTDENYIESQHYNYTVMLQNTNTYERYTLSSKEGQSISFAPDITYRLGPYIGWRWVFLGYAIDLKNIGFGSSHSPKKGFSMSLYSSLLGIDLFWRQTGNDYHIKSFYLGDGIDTSPVKGVDFDGVKSSVKGFNLYYIFNHRKFSYPAAYAQSTVQRRSAGSWLAGIGYTRHTLEVDWEKLEDVVVDKMGEKFGGDIDNKLRFGTVKYTDVSGSCGYAYNWVFAKDFLFNASLSMALAYTTSRWQMWSARRTRKPVSSVSATSTSTALAVLPWYGTTPTGMPVQAPSCIPIIIRKIVSQPTTPLESSTSMWESTLAENDRFVF